jgi:hypothetical protein
MAGKNIGQAFEEDVRNVARARWHLEEGEGSAEVIDGLEIDCVCRTEDVVHLIECTIERKQQKVIDQINRLVRAKRAEEKNGNTVKLWIITKEEPTPDQRTPARKEGITIMSLEEFRKQLLDARAYLNLRSKYPFGSATDPQTDSREVPEDEYIPQPITDKISKQEHNIDTIADLLCEGKVVVLVGSFGTGKSLTVREVFNELKKRFFEKKTSQIPVPVAINLREHWGQTDIDEVLRRHAAKLGFEKQDQLIRAWNAGQIIPLLDGFDELTSQLWVPRPEAEKLRQEARRQAVGVVRSFVRENMKRGIGTLVTGRDHFFNTRAEMCDALGLGNDSIILELGEFTEEQAQHYLERKGFKGKIPGWLPRKPLLLGYLTSKKLLDSVLAIPEDKGQAYAWDAFLDRISEREADLAKNKNFDWRTIRKIMEILALKTRTAQADDGPIFEQDMMTAFKNATGYEPTEEAMTLLRRLPGMTTRDPELGGRYFVDQEMRDALQAGMIIEFIKSPYDSGFQILLQERFKRPLSEFGCAVVAYLADKEAIEEKKFWVAAQEASNLKRWNQPTLALDILLAGAKRSQNIFDCRDLEIGEGDADIINLEDEPLKNLILHSCYINKLCLPQTQLDNLHLELKDCMILRLEGATNQKGLPSWIINTEIDSFDDTATNAAILRLNLPLPVRVLLTIIRKLFIQKGRGRLESALFRGLDEAARQYVSPVLKILESEGAVFSVKSPQGLVWHGARNQRRRLLQFLYSPTTNDPILEKVRQLQGF